MNGYLVTLWKHGQVREFLRRDVSEKDVIALLREETDFLFEEDRGFVPSFRTDSGSYCLSAGKDSLTRMD